MVTNVSGTVACICGSLARLKVNDAGLFGLLAAQVRGSMEALTGGELATVAWAFGTMGFVDRALFRDIRRRFESRIEHCAIHEIVSIAWSFARLGQADEEFLRFTVAPAVRTFIADLTTKQLSLLAWAYAEVGRFLVHILRGLRLSECERGRARVQADVLETVLQRS